MRKICSDVKLAHLWHSHNYLTWQVTCSVDMMIRNGTRRLMNWKGRNSKNCKHKSNHPIKKKVESVLVLLLMLMMMRLIWVMLRQVCLMLQRTHKIIIIMSPASMNFVVFWITWGQRPCMVITPIKKKYRYALLNLSNVLTHHYLQLSIKETYNKLDMYNTKSCINYSSNNNKNNKNNNMCDCSSTIMKSMKCDWCGLVMSLPKMPMCSSITE